MQGAAPMSCRRQTTCRQGTRRRGLRQSQVGRALPYGCNGGIVTRAVPMRFACQHHGHTHCDVTQRRSPLTRGGGDAGTLVGGACRERRQTCGVAFCAEVVGGANDDLRNEREQAESLVLARQVACSSAARLLASSPAPHGVQSGVFVAAVVPFTSPPSDQNPTLHLAHLLPP